jgi:hypothetical protein
VWGFMCPYTIGGKAAPEVEDLGFIVYGKL